MQASNARPAATSTTGIEWASRFRVQEGVKETIEARLKYRLETTEHKIATRRRIDNHGQVVRDQILSQPVPLDASKRSKCPNRSVRIRVDERQQFAPEWLWIVGRSVWHCCRTQKR